MCELLVGLDDVNVGAVDRDETGWLRITVSCRQPALVCESCGAQRRLKDRSAVELVDLPAFGQPARLLWCKRRWKGCCGSGSTTEVEDRIAPAGHSMTTRAARWATRQVGQHRRSVSSVAAELGCDWHTVNRAVIAYGQALLDADIDRVGPVDAVGLDETLFVRRGRFRCKQWATSIVDVDTGQLIDLVPARTAVKVENWFKAQPTQWCRWIRYGVLDLSGPYRKVFNSIVLEHVVQIADPFSRHPQRQSAVG